MSAPLGMGTLRLPSTGGLELLREAWDIGVRVFDVGAHFGEGSSEEHLDNSFTKSQSKTPRRVKNSLLLAELASFLPIFEPSGNG